jgi:hypothetical protein
MPQKRYENDFINWKPRLHQTTHNKGLFWATFLALCLRSLNTLTSHYTLWPWRWRQHVPPKHWYRPTDYTASQPQNTTIWRVTAMKIGHLGNEAVLSDRTSFHREEDGNWFLRNFSKFLLGYMVPHPTSQSFSQLQPWELRISYNQHCISVHLQFNDAVWKADYVTSNDWRKMY